MRGCHACHACPFWRPDMLCSSMRTSGIIYCCRGSGRRDGTQPAQARGCRLELLGNSPRSIGLPGLLKHESSCRCCQDNLHKAEQCCCTVSRPHSPCWAACSFEQHAAGNVEFSMARPSEGGRVARGYRKALFHTQQHLGKHFNMFVYCCTRCRSHPRFS